MNTKTNIVLIGMPGAGKSTVGCLLARATAKSFVDTDLVIQQVEGRRLQEILDDKGYLELRQIEESVITGLAVHNAVIATGGSAVYSAQAMEHLSAIGTVVYLKADMAELHRRIRDLDTRGIACPPGYTFEDIYRERSVLYEKYGEIVIDCAGTTHEEVVRAICVRTCACLRRSEDVNREGREGPRRRNA